MKTEWEYLTELHTCTPITTVGELQDDGAALRAKLSEVGKEGWELAGVFSRTHDMAVLIFKRPKNA